MSTQTIAVDEVAEASLLEMATTAEHMLGHHRDHLARVRAGCCACEFGMDGQTAMRAPDGTVLIISEPWPGSYVITGHRPEGQ
jgi:hypothetical protein